MTKPIMSIKILEDFTTYTDADDDWVTEHVPEAWEAREVLNYITELESTIEELIETRGRHIAELEALVKRLIEAGDRLSDSLCTYPEEEKTVEVCNWNTIVAEYKEREE
jgi:vacuolar-type H+-ATPase catalytic subunit A/Vma1